MNPRGRGAGDRIWVELWRSSESTKKSARSAASVGARVYMFAVDTVHQVFEGVSL